MNEAVKSSSVIGKLLAPKKWRLAMDTLYRIRQTRLENIFKKWGGNYIR